MIMVLPKQNFGNSRANVVMAWNSRANMVNGTPYKNAGDSKANVVAYSTYKYATWMTGKSMANVVKA